MLSSSPCIAANGPTPAGQPGLPAQHAPNQGQDDTASGMSRGNSDASSHTANGVSRAGGSMKAPYEPAVLYATAPAMHGLSPKQPAVAQAYTPLPEKVPRCPKLAVKAPRRILAGALEYSSLVEGDSARRPQNCHYAAPPWP